jgi:hypothetical protein
VPAYELIRHPDTEQTDADVARIGGFPNLPPDLELPICKRCGARMTFFFQIAFPQKHPWAGRIMAVFACTSSPDRDHIDPPIAPDRRHLPDHFLDEYEQSFALMNFESQPTVMRREYIPVLKFERLELKPLRSLTAQVTRVGGKPNWRIGNDFPGQYMGSRFDFLMQIWGSGLEFEFTKLDDAPPQAQVPWFGDPYRLDGKYALLGGPPLYFFGTTDLESPRVYVLNQK